MLRRFELGFGELARTDPACLEIAYHFVGDLKRQKGVPPAPGDDERILQPILERFPLDAAEPKSIERSWHFQLLEEYDRLGEEIDLRSTDYFRYYRAQFEVTPRSEEACLDKCEALLALYRRIRRQGFRSSDLSQLVWVLKTPLSATRHGLQPRNRSFEIFTGHHRAAVAAKLGIPAIPVAVLYDRRQDAV